MRYSVVPGLTALALVLASQAHAQTTVSANSSSNYQTSTAGDVTISSGVTVSPASGAAVTIDSNNSVTNAGTISTSNIDGTTGIAAIGGNSGSITNSGAITLNETYAATDTNGDSIVEAPFAQGVNRTGIALIGNSPFTGTILNSGTITIQGNQSAGIAIDVPVIGTLTHSGSITVLGNNSYGIRANTISGNVVLAGSTSVSGANSAGVALNGDIGGAIIAHNAITSTGYTTTTLPADVSTLTALDTQQGRSALIIGGNVAGGVLLAAAPTDTTDTTIDSDADGIADAGELTSTITTYGSAPALMIGAADRAITIGSVAGTTSGLINRGTITGSGLFAGVDATAVQIGGLGGAVTINGGILNNGTITATSNGAVARGVWLGSGATTPLLTNTNTISAQSTTTAGGAARAITIDAGANLPAIVNSGTLSSSVTSSSGTATAILDQSGTLASVSNTGTITAADQSSTATAIDVRTNTSGFSYNQSLASSDAAAPSLTGAIITGTGNDIIVASAGKISSAMTLGDGDNQVLLSGTAAFTGTATMGSGNDTVSLGDTSSFSGVINFGTGADALNVGSGASFSGQVSGSNVALVSQGGTVNFTSATTTSLGSLTLNGGTLGVVIDPASGGHTTLNVAGATTIGARTTLNTTFSSLPSGATSYVVLQSGSLSGSGNLSLAVNQLPYLLNGSLVTNDAGGTVAIAIAPKTAAELGLNRSETAAYGALYTDISGNPALSSLFSGLTTNDQIQQRLRQMLPDHAGGLFDILQSGTTQLAPGAAATPWSTVDGTRIWMHQVFLTTHQDGIATPGYKGYGFGIIGGGDMAIGGLGRVGATLSYVFGNVKDGPESNAIAHQFSAGGYWLLRRGGLEIDASASAGFVALSDERNLSSTSDNSPTLLTSESKWHGLSLSGNGQISYEIIAGHFYLRPQATLTYYRLQEGSHTGNGGGLAYDLQVQKRTSDELAVTGEVAAGMRFGDKDPEASTFKLELVGGRREIIQSDLGATTARFSGGSDFILLPEQRDSAYVGSVNASVGSNFLKLVATARVEDRTGYRSVAGQVGLRGSF